MGEASFKFQRRRSRCEDIDDLLLWAIRKCCIRRLEVYMRLILGTIPDRVYDGWKIL